MTASYCIRSLFYVNPNATDAVHLSSLEVFHFVVTYIPRCFVVESIKLNAVVMAYNAEIAAYSAEHCTRVDGGIFASIRPRLAAATSAST
jgi:hypothetical protein